MPPTTTVAAYDDVCQALLELPAEATAGRAWSYIVTQWGQGIYGQCLAVTGDRDLAEDASQEALLQIRDGARRFQPPSHGDPAAAAAGWILTVARRSALGLLRRRNRAKARDRRYAEEQARQHSRPEESSISLPVSAMDLRAAIAELPEPQREALVMHHLEGKDYATIAATQGCSEGNARVRAHRGLEKLRKRLVRGGSVLTAMALAARIQGLEIPAATAAKAGGWAGLLASTKTATLPAATIHGGISTMLKCSLAAAACLLTAGIATPILMPVQAVDGAAEEAATEAEHREEARSRREHREERREHRERREERREGHEERGELADKGIVIGILDGMDYGKGVIEMTGEDGKHYRFVPRWIGGNPRDGGGPDKEMLAQIRELRQGAKIKVGYIVEEGPRVVALRTLQNGPEHGVVTGTIEKMEKHKGVIHLRDDEGKHHFLMPHWRGGMPKDGGGLVEETIHAVQEFDVGDRVSIRWVWEERKRIEAIKAAE